jgi:hypothetical protein
MSSSPVKSKKSRGLTLNKSIVVNDQTLDNSQQESEDSISHSLSNSPSNYEMPYNSEGK